MPLETVDPSPSVLSVFLSPFLLLARELILGILPESASLSKVVQPARGTTSNIPGPYNVRKAAENPGAKGATQVGEMEYFLVISISKDVTVICNLGPPNVNFRALRATRKEKDT